MKHMLQKKARDDVGADMPDEVAINIVNLGWGNPNHLFLFGGDSSDDTSPSFSDAGSEATSNVDPPSDWPDSD